MPDSAGTNSFVHLHNHTEYSMLDGAARIDELFATAAEMGMPALATTDHGYIFGAYEFWKAGKKHGVNPVIGCLLAGQEIVTATGVKNIEDVRLGDEVLTHRGRLRRVTKLMTRPYQGRGYTIDLSGHGGRTLTLTEEHPVLIRDRDAIVDWRKPGDITAGCATARGGALGWNSWVCLPRLNGESVAIEILDHLPDDFSVVDGVLWRGATTKYNPALSWPSVPTSLLLDEETSWLLGMFAAEGTVSRSDRGLNGQIGFHLNLIETDYADRIVSALARWGVSAGIHRREDRNSLHVYACNVPVAHLLASLCGEGAKNKRVPREVLEGPEEARKAFIDGLLDGDGKNPTSAGNTAGRRDLKTASRDLAWGLRTLLAARGHWSGVTRGADKGNFPQGPSDDLFEYYMVTVVPSRTFAKTIADDQYVYRPVKSVEEVHLDTQVFNIEVEEDNSYVSDFVLHNCEAYLTPGTARGDRTRVKWGDPSAGRDDVSGAGAYTHMTMWAENTAGMHNLFRMASLASLEGHFYKPRMDRELLSTYGKGIIATTGCPSGEVQTRLRLGQYDAAVAAAADFRDIFGAGNFYCELMDHGLEIETRIQKDLIRLAKDLGLPLVATNDLHYTRPEHHEGHAALLCVQSGSTLADPNRFKFDAEEFYLKSPAEMRHLWRDFPEACDNTLAIAERCSVEFSEGIGTYMPRYPVPEGESEDSWFVKEVERGLQMRFKGAVPDESRRVAEYEIGVITGMGFSGYFLVVADFIRWSKRNGIRVGPGRGSGAGSIAAYALEITDLDPQRHGLIFERFLNPDRVSMPDFDIDFDERRRGEVIKYVTEKYGEDRVAQIVTYGTIKAKQAVKDASRVLGYPFAMGDRITKAMPAAVMGKDVPLSQIFEPSHNRYAEGQEFRALYEAEADVQKVVETAKQLEGLKRQWGVHAAGVIMSSDPLLDLIPIMRREQDGQVITQFDYPSCESLGLIKMDFLGLRNLTIMDDAVRLVERNRGEKVVLEELELDDPGTYELLQRGDTLGVFQFDGGPMRSLLRLMRPDNFEDISAVGALYRPGPMGAGSHTNYALRKNGQQEITPLHPELAEPLAEVLGTTYGLIVYQEQVMSIAQTVAGFSLGQADLLRRAMGKKKKSELDKQYEKFSGGMHERGFSEAAVKALWDVLLPFSDYAFNKAHSAAYGVVSYWTAYLKAHYPAEYMAAVLTSVRDDKDKSALYLNECRRMGLTVLPPDVNESIATYAAVGPDIRFGLAAIRNVGENVVEAIEKARQEKGAFTSFGDFLAKVPAVVCNKRTVESLIKAGAFDSLGAKRRALLAVHEDAVDSVVGLKRQEDKGQYDLFGGLMGDGEGDGDGEGGSLLSVAIPDIPEWDKKELLAREREMLGLYVSDHPLFGLEHVLTSAADCSVAALLTDESRQDGSMVTIAGLITGLQRKMTKQGKQWAIATVEDLGGAVEVLFFPSSYEQFAHLLAPDAVVVVKGRLSRRDDVPSLHAQDLTLPDTSVAADGPVVITLPEQRVTEPVAEKLRGVLQFHRGQTAVHLRLVTTDKQVTTCLADALRVTPSPSLFGDLKALLGPSCLV